MVDFVEADQLTIGGKDRCIPKHLGRYTTHHAMSGSHDDGGATSCTTTPDANPRAPPGKSKPARK
jgi:hypothetical protein